MVAAAATKPPRASARLSSRMCRALKICPAVALYAYEKQHEDELSLSVGDELQVMIKWDDGYWFGIKVRSKEEGLFPGNYVAEQDATSTPPTMAMVAAAATKPPRASARLSSRMCRALKICRAVALYAYEKQHEDELSLSVGDELQVMIKWDDGYWFGINVRSKEEGLFPGNYVAEQDATS